MGINGNELYNIKVGDEICFFEGMKKDKPVAFTDAGKVILCKHRIPLGYAKIKTIEEKENCFLVTADHIVKDLYSNISYSDLIEVLPLYGFKIGYDHTFTRPAENKEDEDLVITEHSIYAYNLSNKVVLVANTFTDENSGYVGFNDIKIYCPGVNAFDCNRSKYFSHGCCSMTVFDFARFKYGAHGMDLLSKMWMNIISPITKNPSWNGAFAPSLYTYEEVNGDKDYIYRLLYAPESLEIFDGCEWKDELIKADKRGWTIVFFPWESEQGLPRVAGRFKTTIEKEEYLNKIYSPDSGWMDDELGSISIINDYNYMLEK